VPWTFVIDNDVLRKMRIWGARYPGLLAVLQQRLAADLGADPDAHLGAMIAPTMTRPYYLELTPDDGVPEALLITLYVDRHDTERQLHIIQGRLTTAHFPGEVPLSCWIARLGARPRSDIALQRAPCYNAAAVGCPRIGKEGPVMRKVAGWVGFALLGLSSLLPAQGPGGSVEVLERFYVAGDGDFLIVPVTVKGKPYPFLVSTATKTTVYDVSLRPLLGERTDLVWVEGPNKSVLAECYRPPEAYLGRLPLPREGWVLTGDLSWARRQGGQDIRGLLGMDFLGRYVVRIDFDGGVLVIQRGVGGEGPALPLVMDEKGQTPCLDADLEEAGPADRFVIDTGCTGTGDIRAARFDMLASSGDLEPEDDGDCYGGDGPRQVGCLARFGVGEMSHRRLHFGRSAAESRLGLEYLKRYRVTLDFPNARIYLSGGKHFDEPEERDPSGLHLHRPGLETVVGKVAVNSPAAKAGFKPGDVVVAIGRLHAKQVSLAVLKQTLRGAGKAIPVMLKRNGKVLTLTLKVAAVGAVTVLEAAAKQSGGHSGKSRHER
jgi:hypothetical protein